MQQHWRNTGVTAGLLAAATVISLFIKGTENAQLVFLLAVLLISRYTQGYFWGLLAAVVSVPLVNYMFTYPFFVFTLSISGYLLTFVTMLTVSLIVSILTSRVQEQEKLRLAAEKEKMRANLLRAVSHDLRTPLTSIVGITGVILDNDLPQEKQHELLQDVNTDAQWLLRMVENLLAITRISGDQHLPLHLETEVVEDVLGEAIIKFHKHFPDVEAVLDMTEDILLAEMDAVLVEQVVLNLLENAVYHGQHTTRIVLSVSHDGSKVEITVTDNGAGIAKDRLLRLFDGEPGVSSDSHKHMGIGLSVCKSIIHAHGGTMMACNNENGGASFSFTLPEKENEYGDQNPDR